MFRFFFVHEVVQLNYFIMLPDCGYTEKSLSCTLPFAVVDLLEAPVLRWSVPLDPKQPLLISPYM